ncbi:MAG: hypothetical protein HC910_22120 [Spirulinaceae cyanobacterium SM2_1_0]|nr:hypothetical protein [Spirulinaceae cyanobacterium SM2_1_0]
MARATITADELLARLYVADYRLTVQSYTLTTSRGASTCPLTPYMAWVLCRIRAFWREAALPGNPGDRAILRALVKQRAGELSIEIYQRGVKAREA